MKQLLASVLAIGFLSGCAIASKKSKQDYLAGDWDQVTPLKTIEADLAREADGWTHKVKATLLTRATIQAEQITEGHRKLQTGEQIKAQTDEMVRNFAQNQTCFLVEIQANVISTATFKNWTVKAKTPAGLVQAEFLNISGVESVPTVLNDHIRPFYNTSHACTKTPIDLAKTFALYMVENYSDSPPVELTWE